jgi:hypothetical protein
MAVFTVIGFWPDTDQRFATHVEAKNVTEAEAKCVERYTGVAICGVISGQHECVDTKMQSIHVTPRN